MTRLSIIHSYVLGGLVVSALARPMPALSESPATILPADYFHGGGGEPSEGPYWEQFADPVLAELVKRGLSGNYSVDAAKERFIQAEAIARQALAPLLPSVSAEASWGFRPFDSVGLGLESSTVPPTTGGVPGAGTSDTPDVIHSVSMLLQANYLIDITGRYYTSRQATLRDAAASKADAETQAANLVALISQTYYDVKTAKLRVQLIEEQLESNENLLNLVETRFKVGSTNALDVLQQRQQLEGTKSRLPLVRAIVSTSEHQLAVLIGEGTPQALPPIAPSLPELGEEPALGKPERLLTARPDLRAASARVEASYQREKSAVRTLLPTLGLNGQVGYLMNYSEIWDRDETWSVGALLSVPLWEGGRNRAGVDQAKAAHRGAQSTLQNNALEAMQQVESALVREREQREHLEALTKQTEAAKLTFDEAQKRYLVGLSEYINVLAALSSYQSAQLTVLQAQRELISARIQLQSALGGDWTRRLLDGRGE